MKEEKAKDENNQQENKSKPKEKGIKRNATLAVLVIILLIVSAAGAYLWRDQQASQQSKELEEKISTLEKQVKSLKEKDAKNDESDESSEDTENNEEPSEEESVPTDETVANIKDAVSSGDYEALKSHMADKVNVIIAASEGVGEVSAADAISELSYLNGGSEPWNFELEQSVVDGYRAGFYKQYFPDNALVGQSENNYVVSFSFDEDGKISVIFMAVNADLL